MKTLPYIFLFLLFILTGYSQKQIDQLPAATSISGSENAAIQQGGVTKKLPLSLIQADAQAKANAAQAAATAAAATDATTKANAAQSAATSAAATDATTKANAAQSAAATDATTKANAAQAFAIQRANHTGTQAQSTITNLTSDLAAKEPIITGGTTSQFWRGDKTWQTIAGGGGDVTLAGAQTLTNKTLSGTSNSLLLLPTGNSSFVQLRKSRAKLADMSAPNFANSRFVLLQWGDSVSGVPANPIADALSSAYGYSGAALDDLDPSGYVSTGSASNPAAVTDYSKWFVRYWNIDATNPNIQWTAPSPGVVQIANEFSIYFLKESSAGTFKVQFQIDNGTWTDVTVANGANVDLSNVSASNGSLAGGVVNWTLPLNAYRIRISRLTGTVGVLGSKILRNDRPGIVKANISFGGNSNYARLNVPSAVYTPILQDLNPDLAIYAMKENASDDRATGNTGISLSQCLDQQKTNMDAAIPRAEWVYFATNPMYSPQVESLAVAETATYQAWSATNNQAFFDGFAPFKDGATLDSTVGFNGASKALTGVASTDVLTSSGHGYANGDRVKLLSLTGGAGLTAAGTLGGLPAYFVRDVTTNTFKLASTSGGAAVDFSSDISAGTIAAPDGVHLSAEGARFVGQLFLDTMGFGTAARTAAKNFVQLNQNQFEFLPSRSGFNGTFGLNVIARGRNTNTADTLAFRFQNLAGDKEFAQFTTLPATSSLAPNGLYIGTGSAAIIGYDRGSGAAGWLLGQNNFNPDTGYLTSWRQIHLNNTARIYDGSLEIPNGSVASNIRLVSASANISNGAYDCDSTILVNAAGGNVTLTLPQGTSGGIYNPLVKGRPYTILRVDNSANTVLVQRNSADTITLNGASGLTSFAIPVGGWATCNSLGSSIYYAYSSPLPSAAKTLFVDASYGSDSTGLRERSDRPFSTLSGAYAAASANDYIVVRPGAYAAVEPNLNCTVEFLPGVTFSSGRFYFATAVTATLIGHRTPLSSAVQCVNLPGGSSNITIEGFNFSGTGTETISINSTGTLLLKDCKINNSYSGAGAINVAGSGLTLNNCQVVDTNSENAIYGSTSSVLSYGSLSKTAANGTITVNGTWTVSTYVQ